MGATPDYVCPEDPQEQTHTTFLPTQTLILQKSQAYEAKKDLANGSFHLFLCVGVCARVTLHILPILVPTSPRADIAKSLGQ